MLLVPCAVASNHGVGFPLGRLSPWKVQKGGLCPFLPGGASARRCLPLNHKEPRLLAVKTKTRVEQVGVNNRPQNLQISKDLAVPRGQRLALHSCSSITEDGLLS